MGENQSKMTSVSKYETVKNMKSKFSKSNISYKNNYYKNN